MERPKDIIIHRKDHATVTIECNHIITGELSQFFSSFALNYKFSPMYKNKLWDGKIRFFSAATNELPIGLVEKLYEFSRLGNYTIQCNYKRFNEVTREDFKKFVDSLGIPFPLRDYQLEAAYQCVCKKNLNVHAATSCHKAGDTVMMSTGIWKNIEDIKIGEYVIGMDGTPKMVLKIFSGKDDLYSIKPKNNRPEITVTKEHILPIKRSDYNKKYSKTKGNKDYIEYISVDDYIKKDNYYKHISNIFYNKNVIEFGDDPNTKLTPYFIGLYLGDGSTHSCQITNKDKECVQEIYYQASLVNCEVKTDDNLHYDILGCSGVKGVVSSNRNIIFREFDILGICFSSNKDKHIKYVDRFIPECIFNSSIDFRLEVLSGLIDSDGHLANGSGYELTFKSKQLRDDIQRLAISLGFVCSTNTKHNKKYNRDYYKVLIMGDVYKIPVRIERKKAKNIVRVRDQYRSNFDVEYKGYDNFYGMEVEDHHYITNGGMITHNSGKSLIIYVVVRFMVYMKLKTVIICPATQLVEQMFGDFISYGWQAERFCHRVYGDQEKFFDAPVTIACWQSLISTKVRKKNPYESFDCILVDEAHNAKAKSISDLSKVCINAQYRFGFSGTYPEASVADWYSIVGSFGPIQTFTTYKKLEEEGHITPLKIYNVILKYDREFKLALYNECSKDYNAQNDKIHNHESRNRFILKMVQNLKENCLILFTKKEAHGYGIFELFDNELKDKTIIYIDGDVSVEDREKARKLMGEKNNVVMLATYALMSTGINIPNLHSIIFASSYKSKTKVLQSIGRSLRLHSSKKYAKLFDIVDDCSFQDRVNKIKFINYSMEHYKERSQFYSDEGWDVKTIKYDI